MFKTETNSMEQSLCAKLIVTQTVNKFPASYETWKFTTVLTRARHWFLHWARLILSKPLHHVSF
jgi:hypothetical protein